MGIFDIIQDDIQSYLKNGVFHADLRPEWGSENPNHRSAIREAIFNYLQQCHPEEVQDSILDLQKLPTLKNLDVSITHSRGMGGFVVCSHDVGVDVEEPSRITQRILERMCTPQELKEAPVKELLWAAKEAVLKCDAQIMMTSQSAIHGWVSSQNEIYKFRSKDMQGWAFIKSSHLFALAIKN